jgi:aminomethyltransferase
MTDVGSKDSADLLTSPLHDRHVALGAKFAAFGGWDMPLEYAGGGVLKEHAAVREGVGVFDVSHLGKATVRGPGARDFVNSCLTNDLNRIAPGQAQYTLCCDESGGVVDDIIAYLYGDDHVFLIPNAANTTEVVRRLSAAAPAELTVTNEHADFAVLAVQGPRSAELLAELGLPTDHEYMSFATADLDGVTLTVCRTGYTGEHGYELIPAWSGTTALWDALVEERAAGARRLLWGVLAQDRGIPRSHMSVKDAAGEVVGEVTSGTFSPSLKVGIGLALLARDVGEGDEVVLDVRGRTVPARVVKPPFVDSHVR